MEEGDEWGVGDHHRTLLEAGKFETTGGAEE